MAEGWATVGGQSRRRTQQTPGADVGETPEAADARVRELHERAVKALKAGERDYGRRKLEEAMQMSGGEKDVRFAILKNVARLLEEDGEVRRSLQLYWEAVSMDRQDVSTWYRLARLALSAGQIALARVASEQGLLLSPNNPLLISLLDEICAELGDPRKEVLGKRRSLGLQRSEKLQRITSDSPFLDEGKDDANQASVTLKLRSCTWAALLEGVASTLSDSNPDPAKRTLFDVDECDEVAFSNAEWQQGSVQEDERDGKGVQESEYEAMGNAAFEAEPGLNTGQNEQQQQEEARIGNEGQGGDIQKGAEGLANSSCERHEDPNSAAHVEQREPCGQTQCTNAEEEMNPNGEEQGEEATLQGQEHYHKATNRDVGMELRRSVRRRDAAANENEDKPGSQQQQQQQQDSQQRMEQFREGLLLELRRLVGIHEAEVESVLQADATKAKEARTEQSRGSSAFNDKDKEDERNAVRRVTRDLDGKSTVVCSQRTNSRKNDEDGDNMEEAQAHLRKVWMQEFEGTIGLSHEERALFHWLNANLQLLEGTREATEQARVHMQQCRDALEHCDDPVKNGCGTHPSRYAVQELSDELETQGELTWAERLLDVGQYGDALGVLGPKILPELHQSNEEPPFLGIHQQERALACLSSAAECAGTPWILSRLLSLSKRIRAALKLGEEKLSTLLSEGRKDNSCARRLLHGVREVVKHPELENSQKQRMLHHALTTSVAMLYKLTEPWARGSKLKRRGQRIIHAASIFAEIVVSANIALSEDEPSVTLPFLRVHEILHALLSLSQRCGKAATVFTTGTFHRLSKALRGWPQQERMEYFEGNAALLDDCFLRSDGNHVESPYGVSVSDRGPTLLQRAHALGVQLCACLKGIHLRSGLTKCDSEGEDESVMEFDDAVCVFRACRPFLVTLCNMNVSDDQRTAGVRTNWRWRPQFRNVVLAPLIRQAMQNQQAIQRLRYLLTAILNGGSALSAGAKQTLAKFLSERQSQNDEESFTKSDDGFLDDMHSLFFISAGILYGEDLTLEPEEDPQIVEQRLHYLWSTFHQAEGIDDVTVHGRGNNWRAFLVPLLWDIALNTRRWFSWTMLAEFVDSILEGCINDFAKAATPSRWASDARNKDAFQSLGEIVLKAYFAMHGLTEGDGANSLKAYSLVHLGRWAYSFSQNVPPQYDQRMSTPQRDENMLGHIQDAKGIFSRAVSLERTWDHYFLLAKAHERLFEYRSALDNFSKAVERGGEYLEPHYRIYSTAQKCLFDNILSPSEIAGFLGGTFEAETDWHSVEEKLRGKLECILEACPYYHKARWALARGAVCCLDEDRFHEAAEKLSFFFHKSQKTAAVSDNLNVHELDDVNLGLSTKEFNELKKKGFHIAVKSRGFEDISRKFIAAVRKYTMAYVIFRSAAGKPEDLSSAWQLVKLTTNAATPKHPFRSISDLGSPLMKILVPVVVAYGKSADWGEADDEALVLLSKHVCPRLSLRDRASLWGCNKSLHKFSSLCDSGRSRLREIANSTGPAFDIFEDVCLGNVGTGSQADSITRFMSSLTHALQEDWKLSHLNRYLREAFSAINVQGPCNEQEAAKEARRVFRSLRELAHEHIKVLEMRGGSQDVNRLLNALQLIGKRVKTPKFAPQQTRELARACFNSLCSMVTARLLVLRHAKECPKGRDVLHEAFRLYRCSLPGFNLPSERPKELVVEAYKMSGSEGADSSADDILKTCQNMFDKKQGGSAK